MQATLVFKHSIIFFHQRLFINCLLRLTHKHQFEITTDGKLIIVQHLCQLINWANQQEVVFCAMGTN